MRVWDHVASRIWVRVCVCVCMRVCVPGWSRRCRAGVCTRCRCVEAAAKESREMLVKCSSKFCELKTLGALLDAYMKKGAGDVRMASHLTKQDVKPLLDRHAFFDDGLLHFVHVHRVGRGIGPRRLGPGRRRRLGRRLGRTLGLRRLRLRRLGLGRGRTRRLGRVLGPEQVKCH